MNARERFERTRRAIARLDEIKLLIMYGCEDWKPEQPRVSGEKSDPTAAAAIKNVDELADKLDALRKEERELTEFIGVSLAIIAAISNGFGEIYAHLLEWRYIDGYTWTRIYEDYGIKKARGHYLLDVCFDWVDSVGVSRLLRGDTEV